MIFRLLEGLGFRSRRPARRARKESRQVQVASAFTVAALVLTSLVVFATSSGGAGQTIVTNVFTDADHGVAFATSNNWLVDGDYRSSCTGSTVSSVPSMEDGPDAGTAVDRLRLTRANHMCERGYALYDVAQTTTSGLDISFNIAIHGSGGNGCPAFVGNPCQADGLVFYLKNGSDTTSGSSSLGAAGGSLGYSPVNSSDGLEAALLGIGFDAYGNFYQQPFGGSNCSSDPSNANTNLESLSPKSLVIRGAKGSTRTTGYCRISATNETTSNSRNKGVVLGSNSPVFSEAGGAIRIVIDSQDTSNNTRANGTGKVYIAAAGTTRDNFTESDLKTEFELPQSLHDASTFKFGFVAGTGGGAENSDIWSASVMSIRDIPDPTFLTPANQCLVTNVSSTINLSARDGVAPYSYAVDANNSLPAGLSLSGGVIRGTPTSSGTVSTTITLTDSSTPTARTASRTFSFNVTSACEPNVNWLLNGNEMQIAPTGSDQDGSCSNNSGSYNQSTVGGFRIAQFTVASRAIDATCTWSAPTGVVALEVLIVGGGGGGGNDAGGGGGGGAIAYHSSLPVSGTVSITVGHGGTGSSSGASSPLSSWQQKRGAAGGSSSVTVSNSTISAAGGSGGNGCAWNGTNCTSTLSGQTVGNTGGSGGTDGTTGTWHMAGASGGNGSWTSGTGGTRTNPGSGSDGNRFQVSGVARFYGAGGGGAGAGLTAASGGNGGGGAGATDATANTGSGGGGGAGTGAHGAAGIVIFRYSLAHGVNLIAPVIDVNFNESGTMNNAGTIRREVSDFDGASCSSTWAASGNSAISIPNSENVSRAKCYRWTYDSGLNSNAQRPSDASSRTLSGNLTSPILVLPDLIVATLPGLWADPRSSSISINAARITGASNATLCLTAADAAGATLSNANHRFDTGTLGTAETSISGLSSLSVTGDNTDSFTVSGSLSEIEQAIGQTRIKLASERFNSAKYVRLRVVPRIPGLTFTCSDAEGSESVLITVKPYQLYFTKDLNIDLGRR